MSDWVLMVDYESPHELLILTEVYAPRFGLKAWRGVTPKHFGGYVLAIEEIRDFMRYKEALLVGEKHEAIILIAERLKAIKRLYEESKAKAEVDKVVSECLDEAQERKKIDNAARAALKNTPDFSVRRAIVEQESASNPI